MNVEQHNIKQFINESRGRLRKSRVSEKRVRGYWLDLATRATACSNFRWLPGMLWHRPDGETGRHPHIDPTLTLDAYPDLKDPATLGCLLHLLREAHNAPGAFVRHEDEDRGGRYYSASPWTVDMGDGSIIVGIWPTEAQAIIQALEAAT